MNYCHNNHEPKYQVIYKPAKGGTEYSVWLVCEMCMEKRCFNSPSDIESVEVLA